MYNALTIARHIIDYSHEIGCGMTNLKLQKLLYFVQAEFLVSTPDHSPCFCDTIEAWDFGPVVPAVYHHYKVYGSAIIPPRNYAHRSFFDQPISKEHQGLINSIVDRLIGYSAATLVEVTHNQSPWKDAYVRGYNNPISNRAIRVFFED